MSVPGPHERVEDAGGFAETSLALRVDDASGGLHGDFG
jgi:hypothetical protein